MMKAINRMTDEEVDEEFEFIIREGLTDADFWMYVAGWKDVVAITEEMLDWGTVTKRTELLELRKPKWGIKK